MNYCLYMATETPQACWDIPKKKKLIWSKTKNNRLVQTVDWMKTSNTNAKIMYNYPDKIGNICKMWVESWQ